MWKLRGPIRKKWLWKLIMVGSLCSVIMFTGGCARGTDSKMKSYGQDGYMGYSNSNPNLLQNNALSYKKDAQLIEQVLQPVNGIKKLNIRFGDSQIHVGVQVRKELTDAELEKVRAEVQAITETNMPQYDVHVKVTR